MEAINRALNGIVIVKPRIFADDRGYFFESYNRNTMEKMGIVGEFTQDNQSLSQKGVVRGLHFQAPPHSQGKLVRVIQGRVLDVAVDIRKGSPTYGQHFASELSADNQLQMWIPPGFAHGFATLEDNTIFSYKCTDTYHPECEGGLLWNDPDLDINWRVDHPTLSAKDTILPTLQEFNSPFTYED